MKIYLVCAAAIALLNGCPEHTATDLDIVPQRAPVAQVEQRPNGHGRSVHRPGALRPARELGLDEPSRPRHPTEGQRLRPEPHRAPRA